MRSNVARYAPVVVGAIFIYSGAYKVLFPCEAIYALKAFGVREVFASLSVAALTSLELYLGWILLRRSDFRRALIAATVLLACFTAFLWYLSTMAHPPSCG